MQEIPSYASEIYGTSLKSGGGSFQSMLPDDTFIVTKNVLLLVEDLIPRHSSFPFFSLIR